MLQKWFVMQYKTLTWEILEPFANSAWVWLCLLVWLFFLSCLLLSISFVSGIVSLINSVLISNNRDCSFPQGSLMETGEINISDIAYFSLGLFHHNQNEDWYFSAYKMVFTEWGHHWANMVTFWYTFPANV